MLTDQEQEIVRWGLSILGALPVLGWLCLQSGRLRWGFRRRGVSSDFFESEILMHDDFILKASRKKLRQAILSAVKWRVDLCGETWEEARDYIRRTGDLSIMCWGPEGGKG